MGTLLIYFVCEVFYTATSDTRAAVVDMECLWVIWNAFFLK